MRKWLIGGAAALALVAAGGAALWVWGKGRMEREIDARLATLGPALSLGWSAREVTGFPFAYVARFRDFTAGGEAWRLSAPWAEVTIDADDLRRAVATFAPEGSLTVETPGAPPLVFDLAQRGFAAEIRALDDRVETDLAFDSLTLAAPEGLRIAAEAGALVHVGGAPGVHVIGGDIDAVAVDWPGSAGAPGDGAAGEARLRGVRLEGRGSGLGAPGLAAFLAAPGAAAELVVEAEALSARAEGPRGEREVESGPAAFRLALGNGRLAYAAEAEGARVAGAAPGALAVGRLAAAIEAPTLPGAAPQPWMARLSLEGAAPDAALWTRLDPGGALPRDPLSAVVELGGEAEMTGPLSGSGAGLVTRSLEIREARAEGLGAALSATGRLDTPAGSDAPEGVVEIRAAGLEPLLEALAAAGAVAPETKALAQALIGVYARPAEDGGLVAEIELREGGVWANGQRLR